MTNLQFEKPPVLEDWTMQVKRDPADEKLFTFTLAGSKTGPDGQGRTDQRFVSHSGRVVIEPENWDVAYALGLAGVKPVPPEFTVRWQVVPALRRHGRTGGRDGSVRRDRGHRRPRTRRARHTLEISGGPDTPIAAVRVYNPPLLINGE